MLYFLTDFILFVFSNPQSVAVHLLVFILCPFQTPYHLAMDILTTIAPLKEFISSFTIVLHIAE